MAQASISRARLRLMLNQQMQRPSVESVVYTFSKVGSRWSTFAEGEGLSKEAVGEGVVWGVAGGVESLQLT